jgi:hypothetical protein
MAGERQDKNKKGDEVKNTPSPLWCGLLNQARTYFEQGSML